MFSLGIFLAPEFSLLALSSSTEPLRVANRHVGEMRFAWRFFSTDGRPVTSSSGVSIPCEPLDKIHETDVFWVLSSVDGTPVTPELKGALRRFSTAGKPIAGVSLGTKVLARAGLLKDRTCTVHWEEIESLQDEFPELKVRREIYVRDGLRWSCAGGLAALELVISLLREQEGPAVASAIADNFLVGKLRDPETQQRLGVEQRYGVNDRRVVAAVSCMENALSEPLDVVDIAQQCSVSVRQLERLWQRYFDTTPQKFYLGVRLSEAKRLIRESTFSLSTIATRCGFVSASHLGSSYRGKFGLTPGQERQKAQDERAHHERAGTLG